jgi:hypothetical protein
MDDRQIWEAFSTSTVPQKDWTHRAHLRLAWLFLKKYPLDEAHLLMRVGIIRLNAFHGLVESPERGYHDTMTRVWLILLGSIMHSTDAASSETFVDACEDQLGKDAVLVHYSRESIMSARARAFFLEPDLLPFPQPQS